MNDKAKDQTTRWENVKGRALWISENMDAVEWLKKFGAGPPAFGPEYVMALCEEMDRMQEEVVNLKEELRASKEWTNQS